MDVVARSPLTASAISRIEPGVPWLAGNGQAASMQILSLSFGGLAFGRCPVAPGGLPAVDWHPPRAHGAPEPVVPVVVPGS